MSIRSLNLLVVLAMTIATTPVCTAWLAPRTDADDATYLHLHEHAHAGQAHVHVHHHHDHGEDGEDDGGDHHGVHDCGQDLAKRAWSAPRGHDVDAPPALVAPVVAMSREVAVAIARRWEPPPRAEAARPDRLAIKTTILRQ